MTTTSLPSLDRKNTACLILDCQEESFPYIEQKEPILLSLRQMVKASTLLGLPLFFTEQTPSIYGPLLPELRTLCQDEVKIYEKTSFSAVHNKPFISALKSTAKTHILLAGTQAHISILQTAKDLLRAGFSVTVANDAMGAQSIYHYSTAIGELKDFHIHVSSVESIFFECIHTTEDPLFPALQEIFHSSCLSCSCA